MREGSTSEQMGWSPRFGLVVVVVVVDADAAVELVADDAEGVLEHDVRQTAPANPIMTAATAVSRRLDADSLATYWARRCLLVRVINLWRRVPQSAGDGADNVVDAPAQCGDVIGVDGREHGDAQLVAPELAVGLGVDDSVLAQNLAATAAASTSSTKSIVPTTWLRSWLTPTKGVAKSDASAHV